jgi:hypothetical protein
VNGGGWWTEKNVGQMGQEQLHGLYWLVNGGEWWNEKCGTDGTRETAWFVLITDWCWVVD